jgi:hypothetical protein
MSSLILQPGQKELITPAHDPFWDSPISRREVQKVFNKLGANDAELIGMADTAALLINFIFERKLGAKTPEEMISLRQEMDAYVEVKKAQMAEMRAKMLAEEKANAVTEAVNDAQANG